MVRSGDSNNSLFAKLIEHIAPLHSSGKWFLLSALVGVVAGLGAIAFDAADQTVRHFALENVAGYVPAETEGEHRLYEAPQTELSPARLILVMAIGGLLSGLLVFTFAPEAEGHGTDAAIAAFHFKRGYIRPIVPLIKLVASALTIGSGGSGGREGPIAQIGAGFGSFLGTAFKLPAHDRRILLAVGMGAGIGAIFRAPLAGALFAAEILYKDADLESEVIVPAAVASTISYSIFSFWLPVNVRFLPLFGEHLKFELASVTELIPLTLLAVVLVAVAVLFIKSFYGIHRQFKKSPLPNWLRPVFGATIAGLIGIALYWSRGSDPRSLAVLGTGYGVLQLALTDPTSLGVTLLLAIGLLKILTTSMTISSGGSGGVFGPSMVIGGCVGGAVGVILHGLWPTLAPRPEIYAIVGMAGFFAGAAHAPISTIIMVSELTGDYGLLLPTLWVSTICFVLCRRWTLYNQQLDSPLDSPAHRGDFMVDVLEGIRVADISLRQRPTIFQGTSLREIVQLLAKSRQQYFPVVDIEGRFVGVFSSDDVRSHLFNDVVWELANAHDVMTTRVLSVTPEDDLNTALKRFTELNLDELPVLSVQDPKQLLGMLRRRDAIACYNQKLHEFQRRARDDGTN